METDARFRAKLDDLRARVLDGAGALDPAIRRAAAGGDGVPEALVAYVDKVRRHAYRVTDADVQNLLGAGYSQDQVFELTVAAAFGAARERLAAGLGAIGDGGDDATLEAGSRP